MSPSRQQIVIAEFCGWKLKQKRFRNGIGYRWENGTQAACSGGGLYGWGWAGSESSATFHLPDYLSDLNAMAEAEAKLNQSQRDDYLDYLEDMGTELDTDERWFVCNATAAQRAEALIRCIGKWEDE